MWKELKDRKLFFVTTTPKHQPVTAATITKGIKTGLDIDTSIFKAHSTCSASTSATPDAGLSVLE